MDDDILKKSFVIYALKDLTNAKIYIGQTTRMLKIRLNAHKCNKKSLIGRAIHAHGWENFTVEILEECATEAELNEREIFWIREMNTKFPNGYNKTKGGSKTNASAGKYAVRCLTTGEVFDSGSAAAQYFGISHSGISYVCRGDYPSLRGLKFEYVDEEKRAAAEIRRNEKKIQSKSVICVETAVVYSSIKDASRKTGIGASNIGQVCHHLSKTAGGYHWAFKDGITKTSHSKNGKPVICVETGKIYENAVMASKDTGAHFSCINAVCHNKKKTAGGCHWQFVTP